MQILTLGTACQDGRGSHSLRDAHMTHDEFDSLAAEWWKLREFLAVAPADSGDEEDAIGEADMRKRAITCALMGADLTDRVDEMLRIASAMAADDDMMGNEVIYAASQMIDQVRYLMASGRK